MKRPLLKVDRNFDGMRFRDMPIISSYQEILQGAANEQEFTLLREYLDTQVFYDLMHGRASFSEATMICFRCRRMGITVKSTIDLLIVQTALENGLFLLHDDRDFTAIKKAVPGLKVYQ
jgi:predicted nucleic acid-binding protein